MNFERFENILIKLLISCDNPKKDVRNSCIDRAFDKYKDITWADHNNFGKDLLRSFDDKEKGLKLIGMKNGRMYKRGFLHNLIMMQEIRDEVKNGNIDLRNKVVDYYTSQIKLFYKNE